MANEKNDKAEGDALALLEEASRQFEAYLKITASTQVLLEPEKEGSNRPDWTRPMGLVLASSR